MPLIIKSYSMHCVVLQNFLIIVDIVCRLVYDVCIAEIAVGSLTAFNWRIRTMKKFLCMLAALLCAAMLPLTGLAARFEASINTTLNFGVRYVNEITAFAIGVRLEEENLKEETEVRIYFDDPSVVETLELLDEDNRRLVPLSVENGYYCIPGDTYDWNGYDLRIGFKKSGVHQYEISLVHSGHDYFIAESTGRVTVGCHAEMTTDVADIKFVVGVPTEFTFTTTANDDKDKLVVGNASFSDPSAIEKLEYYEPNNGQWYPLEGDFGPAQGFPLSDATSKFRVTFNKAGEYSFTAQLVDVADGEQVCSVDADVYVEEAPEVPETGDNAPLMLWAALAMVSLLGVTMIIRRKENA